MSIAIIESKQSAGQSIWINVHQIVSVEPMSMGRETYVRLASGSTMTLAEKVEDVLDSIRAVMS